MWHSTDAVQWLLDRAAPLPGRLTAVSLRLQVIHVNYFGAVIDPVYFPHLEVIGDIGNAIWQLCEQIKDSPPSWDTRCL